MRSDIKKPDKPCCLCEQSAERELFKREFCVVVCRNCGLIRIANQNRNLSRYYSLEYRHTMLASHGGSFVKNKRSNKSLPEWVQKEIGDLNGVSVLEIGCSTGFLLKEFARKGANVSGIEPCLHASGIARSLNGISNIQCCMIEDAKEDGKHDVVILVQTFEHLADPLLCLKKIRKYMKNDGLLFIKVPNFFSFKGFFRGRIGGIAYPSSNHLFIYTKRTLKAILRKGGFELRRIEGFRNIGAVAQISFDIDLDDETIAENYHIIMLVFKFMNLLYSIVGVMGHIAKRRQR